MTLIIKKLVLHQGRPFPNFLRAKTTHITWFVLHPGKQMLLIHLQHSCIVNWNAHCENAGLANSLINTQWDV